MFPTPAPEITNLVTECHSLTCSHFVAQPNPPVTVVGQGFGNFPGGVPFSGTSNYLRITNLTEQWTAGYTGSKCGISVASWDTGRIQMIANIGQTGTCPLAYGDTLLFEVWNPQTMVEAHTTVNVVAIP